MNLRVGDVLLWYSPDPPLFSLRWLIKNYTSSPYTHASIVYDPNQNIIAESLAEGFILRIEPDLQKQLQNNNYHVFRASLTKKERKLLIDNMVMKEGIPYAFQDLFSYLAVHTMQWLRAIVPNTKNRWICSEAIERLYRSIEHRLTYLPPDEVAPKDLAHSGKLRRVSCQNGV